MEGRDCAVFNLLPLVVNAPFFCLLCGEESELLNRFPFPHGTRLRVASRGRRRDTEGGKGSSTADGLFTRFLLHSLQWLTAAVRSSQQHLGSLHHRPHLQGTF